MTFVNEVNHFLQKTRAVPISVMGFILWLTYDFHMFYKDHALAMEDFQIAAVFAYAGTLIAVIKFLFEHISKRIERDED